MSNRGVEMKIKIGIAVLIVAILLGPFLVPVPPPADTVPVRQLADTESRFIDLNGFDLHYKEWGQGERTLVLLHGFGASVFCWQDISQSLAAIARVIAYDRPGFGLTQRPLSWQGTNPYSMKGQVELLSSLLEQLGVEQAVLIGHSEGAAVALQFALEHPGRVEGLILAAPALSGGISRWRKFFSNLPQVRHLGPLLVRRIADRGREQVREAWYNHSTLTEQVMEGYTLPLQAEDWDRGLWEYFRASSQFSLEDDLAKLELPTMIISGEDDKIMPLALSVQATCAVPGAVIAIIPQCGHLPQQEYPDLFVRAVEDFLATMDE